VLRSLIKIIVDKIRVKKTKVVVLLLSLVLITLFHINIRVRGVRKLNNIISFMDHLNLYMVS
jgi:hypothetical protein